jgi:hypothetical protein
LKYDAGPPESTGTMLALLVFCGSDGEPDPAVERSRRVAIEQVIRAELGDEHLPDHVILFPLHARLGGKGAVDHDWCQVQYVTGSLFRKARSPLFQHLTAIRQAFLDSGTKPA